MTKTLLFVATAHYESTHDRVFVDSMLNQTNQNFKAIIVHNGPNIEMKDYVSGKASNILYHESKSDTGQYGCKNRQWAIDHCDTEYIIQTSIQDYWLPESIDYILKGLDTNPDVLVWNSINHLVGPCKILDAKLEWSKLDWGNFAIKTSIAKQVGINHGNTYCADWNFISDCLNRKLITTAKKLDYCLTIHN